MSTFIHFLKFFLFLLLTLLQMSPPLPRICPPPKIIHIKINTILLQPVHVNTCVVHRMKLWLPRFLPTGVHSVQLPPLECGCGHYGTATPVMSL